MTTQATTLGTFSVQVRFVGPTGSSVDLDALVETGATFSVLGTDVMSRLGVQPSGKRRFRLADDTVREYEVGFVDLVYQAERVPLIVVFGDAGVSPLLGATALENLGMGVDPVNRRLIAADALLK